MSRVVPVALRLGLIVLLIVVQVRATPAPGLTGVALAVTLLTVALALTLLAILLLSRPPHVLPRPPHVMSPSPHLMSRPPHLMSPSPHETSRRATAADAAQPHRGAAPWKAVRLPGRASQLVTLIALGLAVLFSIALNSITHSGVTIGVLLVCVSLAVSRLSLRQSFTIGLLAVIGLVVAAELSGSPANDLTLVLSVCLIFLITYAAKQRKATRAAEAREAVLAERARIAREIHDILAHSLSAQLVHLEGAKLLLRAERTAEALDRVTHARDLAKSGLDEARRAVSALREDPPALPVALRTLAKDFEHTAHQSCTLRISGPEQRLPPETELALLRTAQEALTNVRRHAPGSPATVELDFDPTGCDLRVTNPASAEKGSPGGGYGLVGMRERAELLGGTLSAGERDGGFQVHLRVPA
ncbi:sensor histidine kinase [Nonomuraea sp. MTCD27]|uniref:sensor histidine kinase n=1 Tax=Nonomuraea sp. MTCD27 TaxID=1676747 RepID=UPI0035BEE1F3